MFYRRLRHDSEDEEREPGDDDDDEDEMGRAAYQRQSVPDTQDCDVIVLKTDNGWCFDQDIFLPAWKRDAYEAAGQEDGQDGFSPSELVRVDEIRL
ncbi:hypothetical protein CROQUDRAFT_663749, partial [Cronartium quercuum f. sp. fusiforme G11]